MKYTKHGKSRAEERGISENMILKAISEPTQAYYDLSTGTQLLSRNSTENTCS